MENKRTATDILLELEKTVKYIEGASKNNEMLLKQIWNVLIPMLDNISKSLVKLNSAPQNVGPQVTVVESPVVKKGKLSVEAVDVPLVQKQEKAKKKAVLETQVGKIGVNQLVQYSSDSKRVLYAEIKIYDVSDRCINTTKTNTAGRWEANLFPGNYRVEVKKTNPKIDMKYDIEVLETSDNKLELKPIFVQ